MDAPVVIIHGITFERDKYVQFHTIRNMYDDVVVSEGEKREPYRPEIEGSTVNDIKVIYDMATWFVNNKKANDSSITEVLADTLSKHNFDSLHAHLRLFKVCNFLEFERIMAPLSKCSASLLPKTTAEMRQVFGIRDPDFTEEEQAAVAKEQEEMELLLPGDRQHKRKIEVKECSTKRIKV